MRSMPTCPRCGGSSARILAPGYFECTSDVLRDVVPPGPYGNPSAIPVYGPCGFRYQAGAPGTSPCACGMDSVGACAECGKRLCGKHGDHSGGRFVCVTHITEARDRAAAERQRRYEEELEAAKRAVQQERAAIAQALPGLPVDPATGPELAAALARHVPGRTDRFEAGSKSFGRTAYRTGWGFPLWTVEDRYNRTGMRHYGLVVTTDGDLYHHVAAVPDGWRTARTGPIQEASPVMLRYVLLRVLAWTGKELPCTASTEDHYLAATGSTLRVPYPPEWEIWPG